MKYLKMFLIYSSA